MADTAVRDRPIVATVIRRWQSHGGGIVTAAAACMVVAAGWRLANELPHLLLDVDGAHDLRLRHWEVHRWFAGSEVYGADARGDYPPASYALLWPALGWLALEPARWLWAATGLVALGWMGDRLQSASGASTIPQRLLLALLPFSVYASSATFATGQLVNHVLPLLLAGILLLRRERPRWRDDLAAAALVLLALVKPPIAAPFFWIVCFVPGRLRPALLVAGGYVAVTLFAAVFPDAPLGATLTGWLAEAPQANRGHSNLHKWLALLGLHAWMLPLSLAILGALGAWVHRRRSADRWLLVGVCAIIAQLWIHHRLYDHLLIVPAMVPLFRMTRDPDAGEGIRVLAGALFASTWLTLHAPASVLAGPGPLSLLLEGWQTAVWVAALAFLMVHANRGAGDADRRAVPPPPGYNPAAVG